MHVLRLLARGRCRSTCGASRTCSPSTTSPSAPCEAVRARRHRGVPAGRHPPALRRRLLRRRGPRGARRRCPDIHVHGFTALEVTEGAKRLGEPLADVPAPGCKDAGPEARCPAPPPRSWTTRSARVLCPDKINTEEWLEAHRTAHSVGLRSNVTIMFGVRRAPGALGPAPAPHPRPAAGDRRLHRVRAVAVRAHGRADLPQARRPPRTDLARERADARRRPDRLRRARSTTSRRPGSSWARTAPGSCCAAGVNDLGGTLMDENISRAAGRRPRPAGHTGGAGRAGRLHRSHRPAADHALRGRQPTGAPVPAFAREVG